ncbi:MAG: class I SAM-dependent methyltransferase [Saprospiraceae bacterium]|nr:class I SAM-dependent methyltransferase [Saprospiraceae bacterium]
MGLEEQGSKPTGFIGKLIGRLMNTFHTKLYVDYFNQNIPADNSSILDIGCGGGKFIKFLSEINSTYSLTGIDHSHEMVALSKKINTKSIDKKQTTILQYSISEIPFDNNTFDLVTAFETIQFWPDIDNSFLKISKLLKNTGCFLIINYYPSEGSKWWKMANIKSDNEYITKLQNAGFKEININLDFKKGWIIVKACKE